VTIQRIEDFEKEWTTGKESYNRGGVFPLKGRGDFAKGGAEKRMSKKLRITEDRPKEKYRVIEVGNSPDGRDNGAQGRSRHLRSSGKLGLTAL